MLTYAIDKDSFVTLHNCFLGAIAGMRVRRYYTSSIPLYHIGSISTFYKILSRCTAIFNLKNLCEGEDSTCHEPRLYA